MNWIFILHIYANARWWLFLKFGTQMCEVILNLHMKCWTAPCQTRSYWNWTMHSETMACITKSSCEVSNLLWYYTALMSGNSLPMFRDSLWSHLPGSRNPKEQSMTEVNWHNLIFMDSVQCLTVQRSTTFWKSALFPFIGQEGCNVVDSLDLSHSVPQQQ